MFIFVHFCWVQNPRLELIIPHIFEGVVPLSSSTFLSNMLDIWCALSFWKLLKMSLNYFFYVLLSIFISQNSYRSSLGPLRLANIFPLFFNGVNLHSKVHKTKYRKAYKSKKFYILHLHPRYKTQRDKSISIHHTVLQGSPTPGAWPVRNRCTKQEVSSG